MHAIRHLSTFEPEHEWSFQAYLRKALIHRLCDEARRTPRRSLVDPLDSSHPSGGSVTARARNRCRGARPSTRPRWPG